MPIYTYRRVSTAEQAEDNRSSLADQERRTNGAAMMHSAEPPVMFTDAGVSGAIPLAERPEGGKLMAALVKGDTLIAAKLDRLFRSASDALVTAEQLQKRGVALILLDCGAEPVTGNGMSKLFFSMLAAFAEFEKTRILERMQDGRNGKKSRGGHIGGSAPYGFAIMGSGRDAILAEAPDEQCTIALARELRGGGQSFRDVSAHLANIYGRTARNGKPFSAEQVRRILSG